MRRVTASVFARATPAVAATAAPAFVRFQSQGGRGAPNPFIEGEMMDRHSAKHHFKKLNPGTMAHFVKAKIQNDRRDMSLPEVDDWEEFAEGAVYLPTASGPLWVGSDDPRCEKFMRRREKLKKKPQQIARKEPGQDRAKALESHPLRLYFTQPTNLRDPLSIADGLYKTGQIKDYDVKFVASKLKWVSRPPIVTIMGHVDHGKTTLLDYLRKSNVASGEAGGITQSIGAFRVNVSDKEGDFITFIDTPGHQAFSEMRKAGAAATDVIVLIVSTVDGVQPQTREVIEIANEMRVPIIVAANKIDRNEDVEPVKKELRALGLEFEEEGGETLFVGISALKGTNVPELLENIQLQASLLELATPEPCRAELTVIDSSAPDKHLIAGVVRCGTLKKGNVLASGMTYAVVTKILDEHGGRELKEAPVGTPVLLGGFKVLPKPSSVMFQLASARHGERFYELMREVYTTEGSRESYMQALAAESQGLIYNRKPDNNILRQYDSVPFNIVVKAGTFGQLQALLALLYDLPTLNGVHLAIKSAEVGGIDDKDVIILTGKQQKGAILVFGDTKDHHRMDIPSFLDVHYFNVVYHGVQWLKEQMVRALPPVFEERVVAAATCQQVFRASQAGGGNAAGVLVTKGTLAADAAIIRVLRKSRVKDSEPERIYEGQILELRRFKDVVPSVEEGMECGIILNDKFVFRTGDIIQEIEKTEVENDVEQTFAEAAEKERRLRAQHQMQDGDVPSSDDAAAPAA